MLAFHRQSFKPIYDQIGENISDLIESGQLPPNSLLPSERELMQSHRISRNTARQTLDLLVKMGLTYRVQGRGAGDGYEFTINALRYPEQVPVSPERTR